MLYIHNNISQHNIGGGNQRFNNPTRGGRGGRGGGRGGGARRGGWNGSGRNQNQHPYNRPQQNNAFRGPCFVCNEVGHVARACPLVSTNQQPQVEEGNIAQVAGNSGGGCTIYL